MKKYCLLFALLFCAGNCFAFYPRLWMGTYALNGVNNNWGYVSYQGEVTIQPQGENFSVVWRVGSRQTQVGVGILTGDVLSIAFTDLNASSGFWGVASFRLVADGELEGTWTTIDGLVQSPEYLVWKGF